MSKTCRTSRPKKAGPLHPFEIICNMEKIIYLNAGALQCNAATDSI